MSDERFRIVTYGEIARGVERGRVEVALMQFYKYSPQKLAQVFSGERFVIKSGLERTATGRLLAALSKTGLVCEVEAVNPATPSDAISMTGEGAGVDTSDYVNCPKCGVPQPEAECCIRCFVIMDRYRLPQSPQVPHTPASYEGEAITEVKDRTPFVLLLVVLVVLGFLGWLLIYT